jgi:hypothetical protein
MNKFMPVTGFLLLLFLVNFTAKADLQNFLLP